MAQINRSIVMHHGEAELLEPTAQAENIRRTTFIDRKENLALNLIYQARNVHNVSTSIESTGSGQERPRDSTTIHGDRLSELTESIKAICIEGMMPAFENLKAIRESVAKPMPELNRKQLYENFTIVLWRAYKDLMQKAASILDTRIGCLFQKDVNFESKLAEWVQAQPKLPREATAYLRSLRTEWQQGLSDFRNYLEHKDEKDPRIFSVY